MDGKEHFCHYDKTKGHGDISGIYLLFIYSVLEDQSCIQEEILYFKTRWTSVSANKKHYLFEYIETFFEKDANTDYSRNT